VSIPEKRLSLLLRDLKICTKDLLASWNSHVRMQERIELSDPDSGCLPESLSTRLFSKKTTMPAGEFLLFYLRLFVECRALGERLARFKPGFSKRGAWQDATRQALSTLQKVSNLPGLEALAIEAIKTLDGELSARRFQDRFEPNDLDETTFTPDEIYSAQVQSESLDSLARDLQKDGLFPSLAKQIEISAIENKDWLKNEREKLWPGEQIELEENLRRRRFDTLNVF
jgi:hypothetical protein